MGQSPRTPGDVRSNIMSRSSQIRISLEYEGCSRRLRIFRTPLKKELCMISLRGSLFAIALPAALFVGTAAQAHPKLVSATPAPNSTVAKTAKIELHFNEALVSQFSGVDLARSEEHTSELQSLMRISYAVFCLKKKTQNQLNIYTYT